MLLSVCRCRCTWLNHHAVRAVTSPTVSLCQTRLKQVDRQVDVTASIPVSAPAEQLEIINCCVMIIHCGILINLKSGSYQRGGSYSAIQKPDYCIRHMVSILNRYWHQMNTDYQQHREGSVSIVFYDGSDSQGLFCVVDNLSYKWMLQFSHEVQLWLLTNSKSSSQY